MRILFFIFAFNLSFLVHAAPFDWGKTGHRATGEIAEKYLSQVAKRTISELLDGHGLAFVSTYGDEIKSDDAYKKYGSLHYVNFAFDKKYGEEKPNEHGDLIVGIQKCVAVLKDTVSSKNDKAFHLKLLVHFIGDLHQPLHVGRGEDKGGNDIQVRWFKDGSNLHKVWDSDMIDYYRMSYTELSNTTDELSQAEIEAIKKGELLDWMYESQNLAKRVYASAAIGEELGYKYMYEYFPMVRKQLHKGGIRLAKVLNYIFN